MSPSASSNCHFCLRKKPQPRSTFGKTLCFLTRWTMIHIGKNPAARFEWTGRAAWWGRLQDSIHGVPGSGKRVGGRWLWVKVPSRRPGERESICFSVLCVFLRKRWVFEIFWGVFTYCNIKRWQKWDGRGWWWGMRDDSVRSFRVDFRAKEEPKKSPGVVGAQLQQKHNVPSKLSLL